MRPPPVPDAVAPRPSRIEYIGEDGKLHWRTLPTVIEMESLLPKVMASAGSISAQPMTPFGPGWGGGAQLFWRPPPPQDTPIRNWPNLRTSPKPIQAGRYRVTLVHTIAPDYGIVRVFLKGQPVKDFDGYAATVMPRRLELGEFQLGPAGFELLFTVFARNPASSGYFVGLDRIELQPVD